MSERIDPFATLKDPPVFTTKPKPQAPVPSEAIEHIAEQNDFPSRQAAKPVKAAPRKKWRIHRTGRNQQFNAKATPETIQRFYKAADEKNVPLGELLKQALDALEAIGPMQTAADKKQLSLRELVVRALESLDRAGGVR